MTNVTMTTASEIPRGGPVGGVFINYRGEDSQTAAVLIDRELVARFGSDQVFLDCRSIPAGTDFVDALLGRLQTCSVLLVVIGPRWLTLTDAVGQRRIDDPDDWIHRELVEAFTHGLRVLPVLVDGAELPHEAALPDDISGLSRRQYVHLRRRYAAVDLAFLVERIAEGDPELTVAEARLRPSTVPVPRQLPAPPRLFTGRVYEEVMLSSTLDNAAETGATVLISAIGGCGGIGKTWLALHWAHQHMDQFPDGQLFVDLRGFTPTDEPMPPAEAVRNFLNAMGVAPARIPMDLDAQVGLFRSLVADRRMLIVLDNARDTAQVAPLLPGTSGCMVLVTSRRHLAGLITTHGARSLDLDVLSESESRQMLTDHLGHERMAAEPDAVVELLQCCARLPLALSIVAARATTHPAFSLRLLAQELQEYATRLDGLDAGEIPLNLRATFSSSYDALPPEAAVLFELLGLAPGPDIGLTAVASLAGRPVTQVRGLLRELENARLVIQSKPDRYSLHDLLRLYAADQAHQRTDDSVETALRRLADFYLQTAHAGDRLLDPHSPPIKIDQPVAGCCPHPLADDKAARAWFKTEHPCLLATQRLALDQGWHLMVWGLAWAMDSFHFRQGHLQENLAVWEAALAAAHHLDDPAILVRAHQTLGRACTRADKLAEALDHLDHALTLAKDTGDHYGQALTHRAFATAWERQGDDWRALEHATSALHLFQALGEPAWGEAMMLTAMGQYSTRLGQYQQARSHCEAALTLHRRNQHREGEATTLDSLGYLAHRTGQYAQALDYYQQALTLSHEVCYPYLKADTLNRLSQTYAALGDNNRSQRALQQALALYREQHRQNDAQRVQQQLEALARGQR